MPLGQLGMVGGELVLNLVLRAGEQHMHVAAGLCACCRYQLA